jgi:uncharacterized membrane-anchored protein
MFSRFFQLFTLFGLTLFCLINPAFADDPNVSPAQLAWQTAMKAAKIGPADQILGDQATLHIPSGMAFIPKPEASDLMTAWGNSNSEGFFGLVVPRNDTEYWVMAIDHTVEGYVKDDDAKNWNADELLQSLKDGTEAQNKERVKMNIPAMDITGWIQTPSYDPSTHRLLWSIRSVDRGSDASASANINYNTYALGRDGYFEVNLMTSEKEIAAEKSKAQQVLASLEYNKGKRYEDFVASTDHIAEYGLAALIGGVVAKKLGLLALASVFILKFIKIIAVGVMVAGGSLLKFFRRKPTDGA